MTGLVLCCYAPKSRFRMVTPRTEEGSNPGIDGKGIRKVPLY